MDEQRIRELREECEDGLARTEIASVGLRCVDLRALCDLALEALKNRAVWDEAIAVAEEVERGCRRLGSDDNAFGAHAVVAELRGAQRRALRAALDAREGKA